MTKQMTEYTITKLRKRILLLEAKVYLLKREIEDWKEEAESWKAGCLLAILIKIVLIILWVSSTV